MFTSLKQGATAVTIVLALAAMIGFSQVGTAAAGAKTKADILIESLDNKAADKDKDSGKSKGKVEYSWKIEEGTKNQAPGKGLRRGESAGPGQVCCRMRTGPRVLTDPRRCRKAGGAVAPRPACQRR